ncbi:MAG: HAMP domain-containing histidine kinase [Bacteroidales bacterium]|nr:HAMP domain-containing histidine kinase [Bacteroidales bacterium]
MKRLLEYIRRNIVWLTFALSAVCLLLSLAGRDRFSDLSSTASSLQKKLQQRESLLDDYAFKALDAPADKWLELKELPEDMVIYRYRADSLQSWAHQFPFANDDLVASSIYQIYRTEHYLDGQGRFIYPFSYLSGKQEFVNIGSCWYLIKSYLKDDLRVIAGLLVKTDSQVAQALSTDIINPELGVPQGYDIVPLALESSGAEIQTKDNEPLFMLVSDTTARKPSAVNPLVWISIALAAFGLFLILFRKRTNTALIIYILGITLLRIVAFRLGALSSFSSSFFSPAVYADEGLFSSIGDLLLNNLYVSLMVLGIYMMRNRYIDRLKKNEGWGRRLGTVALCIIPIVLCLYINDTLRSLILNSSVNMELHRVTSISSYTVLCYLSYAILFLMLMFSLQLIISLMNMKRKRGLLSIRNTILFALGVSVYMLLTVSSLSAKKEAQWTRLLANRLSVERDLGLELELREIEDKLLADPISGALLTMPQENMQMLQMRFSELYFQSIRQKYVINMSVCRPNESIQVGQMVVNCLDYYRAKMTQYDAVPIADGSAFYYLSNFNGQVGYLGLFTYLTPGGTVNLFLEITARYDEEQAGYPDRFSDYQPDDLNIPPFISYAKYYGGRLVMDKGRYDYPVYDTEFESDIVKKDGYIHRINKVTDQNTVVISRPQRSIFPYIVSLSYLVLFFSFFFLAVIRLKRARIRARAALKRTRKSWGRRLNFLITVIVATALIAASAGSLWYSVNYYKLQNRLQMEEKIKAVGKVLSSYFTYAQDFSDVNSSELFTVMDRLANDTHADINLYDPSGKIIHSTKMDLFRKYILSSRMNPDAYEDIVIRHRSQAFNREKAGAYKYYSLYSPISNYNGKLMAIADIPYFTRGGDLNGDLSYAVATIINVSILLLVVALFFSRLLFSRVTRPLTDLSNKMRSVDVSSAPEHISYSSNDELGLLVDAYNKMVDDVAESTRKMAIAEREKAWSDMARQIAHEIKNPLTPMKLSIQRIMYLKQRNAPGWEDKLDAISQSLLEQIDILSNTASEFSSYAKFYMEDNIAFNLYDVVKEQKDFFDNKENIRISFSYTSDNCMVYARRGQIVRVLVNLISNSIQELENSEGKGFVSLGLSRDGDFWKVSVDDNGRGVSQENLEKLFQPNFTTKTSGNGLGLAISRSIIEQSGGSISYSQSELGGACFCFTLPVYQIKEEHTQQ